MLLSQLCRFTLIICTFVVCLSQPGPRDDTYEKLKASLREKHLAMLKAQRPKAPTSPESKPVQNVRLPDKSVDELAPPSMGDSNLLSSKLGGIQARNITRMADLFYELALSMVANTTHYHDIPKIHIIRIPKAGSSSLSAVARRAVGCGPPGPCCRYPGEPKGSCPLREMFACQEQKRVIGCTDHFPYLWYLFRNDVPTISMMRNPFSRALSGFFYPGIHHNSECTDNIASCFVQYTRNAKWRNIAVKMLTGDYGYSPRQTCVANTTCTHSLQLAIENLSHFTFMGVAEMWELSLLILHQKMPSLRPNLNEFRMGVEENSVAKGTTQTENFWFTEINQDLLFLKNRLLCAFLQAIAST